MYEGEERNIRIFMIWGFNDLKNCNIIVINRSFFKRWILYVCNRESCDDSDIFVICFGVIKRR